MMAGGALWAESDGQTLWVARRRPDPRRRLRQGFLLYEFTQVVPGVVVQGLDISAYAVEHAKPEVQPVFRSVMRESFRLPTSRSISWCRINTLHNSTASSSTPPLREIERVGRRDKFVCMESYRNEAEKVNLLYWANLTCEAFCTPEEWQWWFQQTGYTGDHGSSISSEHHAHRRSPCDSHYRSCRSIFGLQPLTNRFLVPPRGPRNFFPSRWESPPKTGLVRQLNPAPAAAMRSRFDWIKYNEAEDHLDDLVARICVLARRQLRIGSSSPSRTRTNTMIRRFQEKGFGHTHRLDPGHDLGIHLSNAGLETIQQHLTPKWAPLTPPAGGRRRRGHRPARLGTCPRPPRFPGRPRSFGRSGGYLVLEVPDSQTFLDSLDYTMPWEEHVSYFTPFTFQRTLAACGPASPSHFLFLPVPMENSLVADHPPARTRRPRVAPLVIDANVATEIARAMRLRALNFRNIGRASAAIWKVIAAREAVLPCSAPDMPPACSLICWSRRSD